MYLFEGMLQSGTFWLLAALGMFMMPIMMIYFRIVQLDKKNRGWDQRGYFSFWLVALVDWAYYPVLFATSWYLIDTIPVFSAFSILTPVCMLVVLAVYFMTFWSGEVKTAAKNPEWANWTVDGRGHNFIGIYHLFMFAVFGGTFLYVSFGFIAYAMMGFTWTYAAVYIAAVLAPFVVGNLLDLLMPVRPDELINMGLKRLGIDRRFNI